MSSFDPVATAQQLATAYVQSGQTQINAGKTAAQRSTTGLTTLKSALSAFESAIAGLSSNTSGLRQFSATLGTAGIATASATSKAQAGTYSFHVEQLATAHQLAFEDLPAIPVPSAAPLVVNLADGRKISVNLATADADGSLTISQAEIARAINQAQDNAGKVTASVVTVAGSTTLLLSAGATGAAGAIGTIELPDGTLKTATKELAAARDAVVWLGGGQGGTGGVEIRQASNTLTAIEGVNLTLTRAMTASEAPLTLTVAGDSAATGDNVKKFVDAYNTLKSALDNLTKVNADDPKSSGAFATDAGIRSLRGKLNSMIRQEFGGLTLVDLGIKASRDGSLALDRTKLDKTLAANPTALEGLFGKASASAPTGLFGALDQFLDVWLKSGTGQLAGRKTSLEIQQKRLTERQTRLDGQYDNAYGRYLQQFTQLQALQSQMNQTSGLFTNVGAA